jgi:hypothetical protein
VARAAGSEPRCEPIDAIEGSLEDVGGTPLTEVARRRRSGVAHRLVVDPDVDLSKSVVDRSFSSLLARARGLGVVPFRLRNSVAEDNSDAVGIILKQRVEGCEGVRRLGEIDGDPVVAHQLREEGELDLLIGDNAVLLSNENDPCVRELRGGGRTPPVDGREKDGRST